MTTPTQTPTPANHTPSRRLLITLAGALVLIALAGYGWMRSTSAGRAESKLGGVTLIAPVKMAPAQSNPHDTNFDQISAMADSLAAKLKDKPKDAEGWAMLARTYGVLERNSEALIAYEKAVALRPKDEVLLADYAESLAINTKRSLAEARELVGLPATPPADKPAAPQAKSAADAAKRTVSGTVSLASALIKKANPNDTVFIFARPAEGSRMPLALLRKQVKDLPIQFTLDDSMAMSPGSLLSQAGLVLVGARISKSGNAMPETGDLTGQLATVTVGSKGLVIEIKDVVGQ
jgi:cytochrome c-type biogenesis protein CcmH